MDVDVYSLLLRFFSLESSHLFAYSLSQTHFYYEYMMNFIDAFKLIWIVRAFVTFVIYPVNPAISALLSYQDKDNQAILAGKFKASGYLLNQYIDSDLVKSHAADMVSNVATNGIQNWLVDAGTVRTPVNLDKDFSIRAPQLELLIPWYENQNGLIFTQHNIHRTDKRLQTNNGLGYRFTGSEWMRGINVFYDYDTSDRHSRLCVGWGLWCDLVTLRGIGGNAASEERLSLKTTQGAVSTVTANGGGTDSTTLTSITAAKTATISVDGHSSLSATVKMTASDSIAQLVQGSLTVTKDGALADDLDSNSVQARVADVNDKPLAGEAVTFMSGNSAVIRGFSVSDAVGTVTASLTSTKPGAVNVTAVLSGFTGSVATHLIAGSVDDSWLSITATPDNIVADGKSASQVLVVPNNTSGIAILGEVAS